MILREISFLMACRSVSNDKIWKVKNVDKKIVSARDYARDGQNILSGGGKQNVVITLMVLQEVDSSVWSNLRDGMTCVADVAGFYQRRLQSSS